MIRADFTGFEIILVGLLISGFFSLHSLIRRRRAVSSACLLGASVGGLITIVVASQFPEELVGIAYLWVNFIISIGFQGVLNFFGPLVPLLFQLLVVVSGMVVGAAIGWWLTRRAREMNDVS